MAGELLSYRGLGGWQVAPEERVGLGEPGLRPDRRGPDGGLQPLCQPHEVVVGPAAVGPGPGDYRGVGALSKYLGRSRQGLRVWGGMVRDLPGFAPFGLSFPVVHRDGDEDRTGGLLQSGVVGALDHGRDVLRSGGLVAPLDVRLGEAGQPPGEHRFERQVSAVLLPGGDQ